jgi:hypothetical protein
MATFEYIKKRCSNLESIRSTWEDHWQEILDYVMPRKADVTFVRSKGEKRTEVLYDSTAITANNLLAASLQGTLTSASLPWFHLKLRDTETNQNRDVQLWLEDSAKRMYEIFNESNFNTEVHELYLDLVSIGTGAIFVEEGSKGFDKEGIHFNCLHIAEYYIQENINGKVDTLYRKYKLTARQAIQEFGEEKVGEKILEAVKEKPDKEFNFIHAVEPREDYERATGKSSTKLPVHSCHVCTEDKMVVRTGGYNEFPYLVPRWSKATGEIFGRSPSYNALPDIKTLNKAVEIGLKAWAKAIDPPLLVTDDGVIGRVRMTPAGITVVRQIDIEYVGPLARSQRMEESVAIDRLYELAMSVVQVDPSIMDNINHDEAIRLRGDLLGVPKIILRARDEVQELREQRQQAQMAQQQAQQQQQQAQAALTQGQAMSEMGSPEAQEGMAQAEQAAQEEGLI